MRPRRAIISGGGTGGHLYPALVLGRKLREQDPRLELTFVGGGREAEREILAREDVRYVPMRIEGLIGRGRRGLCAAALLPGAFLTSLGLLARLRPRLVVGVGGYSSGPIVLLAALLAIPTLILEQNVKPGFTNRMLVRWARKAAVAFEASLPYFRGKGVHLGNPVRPEFAALRPRESDGRMSLLVFGGSQGSRVLNRAVTAALPLLAGEKGRLTIVHQTGPADLAEVRAAYAAAGFGGAEIAAFLHDMPARFGATDLVLCRAGATSCAELIAARKPSILVPFAQAADDHQTANAAALRDAGGADLVPEAELSPARLAAAVLEFLARPERLALMARRLEPLRKDAAADDIAALALALMKGRP
jgi:UDP-N-acetylglucosamine--N-acetylmuramyl-(pentapeptide) pyrophosphoryl-undecaprenol N-acetylglucosamine transferase